MCLLVAFILLRQQDWEPEVPAGSCLETTLGSGHVLLSIGHLTKEAKGTMSKQGQCYTGVQCDCVCNPCLLSLCHEVSQSSPTFQGWGGVPRKGVNTMRDIMDHPGVCPLQVPRHTGQVFSLKKSNNSTPSIIYVCVNVLFFL